MECEVSALPGAAGSCPDIPVGELFAGPQICGRGGVTSFCEPCARYEQPLGITTAADCEIFATTFNQNADVIANCQRGCFGFYACATSADCPADRPFCLTNGQTDNGQCFGFFCATNADCPDALPFCESGQCLAECGTNADCPADRPLCDAGQCVVSSVPSSPTSSPLDGMGGGSSA